MTSPFYSTTMTRKDALVDGEAVPTAAQIGRSEADQIVSLCIYRTLFALDKAPACSIT
jgi:hypothetical protein